eukprot:2357791-Ditylum_brightwellii.AAC.1
MSLLDAAKFQQVKKLGFLVYCIAPSLELQQEYIQRLLGTLQADQVDVEYWLRELNAGNVTITADGTVTGRKDYFAALLYNADAVVQANKPIAPGIQSYMAADNDLSQKIMFTKAYGIDLKTSWVKAHQDIDVTYFQQNTPTHLLPRTKPTDFPLVQATISIDEMFITGNQQQTMCAHFTSSSIAVYIWHKTGLTIPLMEKIVWDQLGTALTNHKMCTK